MKSIPRREILRLLATMPMLGSTVAQSQVSYPSRPVRMVVPYPPGGSLDGAVRPLAAELTQAFSRPFVVDNVSGANGKIATDQVLAAPPDGHTLLCTWNGSFSMQNPKEQAAEWLPRVQPLSMFAEISQTIVSNSSFEPKSFNELIEYAKANPGKVRYASSGIGGQHHLLMELLCLRTDTKMLHVPYRGMAQMVPALLSGECNIMFAGLATPMPFLKEGRLRVLAYGGRARHEYIPNVPTFEEVGLSDFPARSWFAVLAPKGVPSSISERLSAAIWSIANSKNFRDNVLLPKGYDAQPTVAPDALHRFLAADRMLWRDVIERITNESGVMG